VTFKADLSSVVVSAQAKAAFQTRGHDITQLFSVLQRQAMELQILLKQVISLHPNDSVISLTINAAGSGGTQGPVTITGTTGVGTKFQARGNISGGGSLTGNLVLTNVRNYSTDPTTPGAEPVTGGNLSGATVALTMTSDNAILTSLQNTLAELA